MTTDFKVFHGKFYMGGFAENLLYEVEDTAKYDKGQGGLYGKATELLKIIERKTSSKAEYLEALFENSCKIKRDFEGLLSNRNMFSMCCFIGTCEESKLLLDILNGGEIMLMFLYSKNHSDHRTLHFYPFHDDFEYEVFEEKNLLT